MRLLFVQGGVHVLYDEDGNAYVDSNGDRAIWERYRRYCDELRLILRTDGKVHPKSELLRKAAKFDESLAKIVAVPNVYVPRSNYFRPFLRLREKRIIAEEVRKADRVIARTVGFGLSNKTIRECRNQGKPYLIEAIDFPSELRRNSGSFVKRLTAPIVEASAKREILRAPYVVYVTQRMLQERYPTRGKSIGCSDVELPELDSAVLEARLSRTREAMNRSVIFGTAGEISGIKGQEYVISAMGMLKREGITGIEYRLAGAGSQEGLRNLADSLGVGRQVRFDGAVPHSEIFAWYDSLDVYIQPSMTEALCRAIIEAMSRALPVTCSDAGGNPELPDRNMIFHAGDVDGIAAVMREMMKPEVRMREAERSFRRAHDFEKSKLDAVRDDFYSSFTGILRRS